MSLFEIFLIGILGGVSPGPITALMLGETFKNGLKKGLLVPAALLLSNLIVGGLALSLLFLGKDLDGFMYVFSVVGALVLVWMGIQEWRASGKLELNSASQPFKKALLIDMVNPHPYIFWLSVLAPAIVLRFQDEGTSILILGWCSFVAGLIGTKALIVVFANLLRPWLTQKHLRIVNRVLAVALIGFGVKLLVSFWF